MKKNAKSREIFSVSKRVQHLFFFLTFTCSFLTGTTLPGGKGSLFQAGAAIFGGKDILYWWHAFFGVSCAAVIAVHLFYLAVRSYIESIRIRTFPLKFTAADLREFLAGPANLFAGRKTMPRRYTPLRKAFYWFFLAGGAVVTASGFALSFWDWLDVRFFIARLNFIASIHGGLAFIMGILSLWHVYDILGGGRRMAAILPAITGRMPDEKLKEYYPDEYQAMKDREKKEREEYWRADAEKLKEKERAEERKMIESLLESGNKLAKENRFLDAAEEYRKALMQFPGYSQAQYNLALVLEKAGKIKEALMEYQRFMEIDPFHPLAQKVRTAIERLRSSG